METFEKARFDSDGGPPPPAPTDTAEESERRERRLWEKPSPRLRSTKGGAGSAAGATPKKAYRPPTSKRPRPAGKKPDAGPR